MANPIFSLFASSPFHPLQEHMGKVLVCTTTLETFFIAIFDNDWEKASMVHQEINQLEEEADDLKREIRQKLPEGLFMPVSRTDLVDLIGRQDRIANKVKDVTGLMIGRKMNFPSSMQESMVTYIQCTIEVCKKATQIIQELDKLLETGFRGQEVTKVETLIFELDDMEDKADKLEREVRLELYEMENGINPVEVMFLYKIIDWIGEISNRAQSVGHRLHLMLAR